MSPQTTSHGGKRQALKGPPRNCYFFHAELRCQLDSMKPHKSIYDKDMTFEEHNLIDAFMVKMKRML